MSSASTWTREVVPCPTPISEIVPGAMPYIPGPKLRVCLSRVFRRCGRCRKVLPQELFNRMGDGRQGWCRACFREYFRERGDLHRRQSGAARIARAVRARAHVLAYLRSHPCRDCGQGDPVVLEFDHVGRKRRNVSALVSDGLPLARIDKEIEHCEVVCVNCHRRRTARRAGWRKLTNGPVNAGRSKRDRNRELIVEMLRRSQCVDCGERDICVLEFDHVGVKQACVSRLTWSEVSLDTIRREIAECQVRCANCHRRRTSERAGHFRSSAV